jgi:hypothetical protein
LATIKDDTDVPKLSLGELRKRFVNSDVIPDDMKYLLQTPKHVRDGALDDLVTAYKGNFRKRSKDPSHTFEMKFRRRKDNQAITIPHEATKIILDFPMKSPYALRMYPNLPGQCHQAKRS